VIRTLVLAGLLAAGPAFAAQPVTLRAAPVDADGSVTLADLFEGTSSAVVVGAGPTAGGSVVLDAARVQAAARAAGLSWANPAGVRRIVVRSGATAAGPAQPGAAEALTYARSLNAGEVVAAEDLTWAAVVRAPADAPGDAAAAIGLQLRKPVRAGAPVSSRDLTAARVIAKNDAVSVQYRAGAIRLSLKGKALNAAAPGEPVRVMNAQSKTVIDAIAAGPGLAVVGPEAGSLSAGGRAALASR
jgi:flagella basal body P-ring formation protein FlgA